MKFFEVDGQEPVNKPIVYVDMDGVLADFFGGVEKLYGVEHWKQLVSDKTKDLKQEVISRIQGTDFFKTLPKFPTADELIATVKQFTGGTFSILSSPDIKVIFPLDINPYPFTDVISVK